MSLDVGKLEKARELAGGIVQARCPACAEGGGDRKGEHLRVYPDGRYGCCVHPKDGGHRKRIFALVGDKKPGSFTLRLKTPPALPAPRSVKAALTAFSSGTPGTPKTESENGVPSVPTPPSPVSGTLIGEDFDGELKDTESAVPSVPKPPVAANVEKLPNLTPGGDLSIPFDSDLKYHWWKPGGQSVEKTRAEVLARMAAERAGQNG